MDNKSIDSSKKNAIDNISPELNLRKKAELATERWISRNRSLVLRQTPIWAQSFSLILISLGATTLLAAFLFKIDEVVTVSGKLESVIGSTEVKTPAGGKILSVYATDGDMVEKGDNIIQFDTRQASLRVSTIKSLILLEQADLTKKINVMDERYLVLKKKLETNEQILQETKKLVETGGFQRMQYLQQLDSLYELNSNLKSLLIEKKSIQLASEKQISQLSNELKQAELQLQYQNVVAPVSGIIFDSKARVDGVLQPGEAIMTIIPQQGLKANVFIANKDIGFVKSGQSAQVRIDAFPFTRYGEITGNVDSIGADVLSPDETASYYRFPVSISLSKSNLSSGNFVIPLRSGMSVTANLKLREKRLISLLSDMLVDQTESIRGIRQQ